MDSDKLSSYITIKYLSLTQLHIPEMARNLPAVLSLKCATVTPVAAPITRRSKGVWLRFIATPKSFIALGLFNSWLEQNIDQTAWAGSRAAPRVAHHSNSGANDTAAESWNTVKVTKSKEHWPSRLASVVPSIVYFHELCRAYSTQFQHMSTTTHPPLVWVSAKGALSVCVTIDQKTQNKPQNLLEGNLTDFFQSFPS